ncbi:hypothetical protein DL96DRAFT_1618552 [Flagelloscypha sp. PMI_526]|nr:hypothetical protein DL96DRAFT_1618552 [Flagelloscypha sp. PMI_526]
MTSGSPDTQNSLFTESETKFTRLDEVPVELQAATTRLNFTPTYLVVGIYRLLSDPLLRIPAWEKCRNGTRRGLLVGAGWVVGTYFIQKQLVKIFIAMSPHVIGISGNRVLGLYIPWYTWHFILAQVTHILWFFLSRNIQIARSRVYAQTVTSRAKSADFFGPYVEEYDNPPVVNPDHQSITERIAASGFLGRLFIKRLVLAPLALYPIVGTCISAYLKSVATSKSLHRDYFDLKGMSPVQSKTWVEERKWDYRVFGFFAALLEGLPIVGLFFNVSNRVGAAMWAFDLEKRQHFVKAQKSIKHP